jgi:predicted SAM-dependent methyltransferase
MLRRLIDFINIFTCFVKRTRIIKLKGEFFKVNLGSGLSVAPGWINVDASPHAFFSKWPRFALKIFYRISEPKKRHSKEEYCDILKSHIFVHHNVQYGIPFPENSVNYLYSSHLLEHLFKEDAKKLLKEAHRVLKKGGIIRICVPDLEYAISFYQKRDKEIALNYFFSNSKSGYFARHKYMYDHDLLRQLLEEAGFANIKRCSYRESRIPDINVLDNRPEETLYMEATK